MNEMKTLTFPGDTEPREIVDAKARAQIGDLNQLETTDKSSLVAAINEAAKSGGGGSADYVLTESDKAEIAAQAAELVEVPTEEQINGLIHTALGVVENGTY